MCHARRKDPTIPSRTTDANLDCALFENALVFVVPKNLEAGGFWHLVHNPPGKNRAIALPVGCSTLAVSFWPATLSMAESETADVTTERNFW